MALILRYVTLISIGFCSSIGLAFEALSEDDLDNVSAEMGSNLLRVFGAPSAGANSDEVELVAVDESENNRQAEKSVGDEDISNLSQEELENPVEQTVDGLTVVNSYRKTVVQSELNGNESRTEYDNRNYSLEPEFFDDGSVATTRDFFIDRVSIDNLRGSNPERLNTVGNIAISDWTSQGTIHVQER